MTTKVKRNKNWTPCRCFTQDTGSTTPEDGAPIYGQCSGNTRHFFAPGHDARLKGVLQRLYRSGQEYHYNDGSMLITVDPLEMAKQLGWLHLMDRPTSGPKAKRDKTPTEVKVGRWTYKIDSIIESLGDEVQVSYVTKKGERKIATVRPEALIA